MNLKVKIPAEQRKPDSFYEQVAARWTVVHVIWGSKNPAKKLAEANDVPVSTVHRWVKEARRRGILGPGQRGAGKPCRLCGRPMDEQTLARYRAKQQPQGGNE